jgi:hydrogenase-4 membrane subunit HyfE
VDVGEITLGVLIILGPVIIIETAFVAAFILMWRMEETRKYVRERRKILQINVCICRLL